MNSTNIFATLKEIAYKNGAGLVGVANLEEINTEDFLIEKNTLSKYNSAISVAVPLLRAVLDEITDYPTKLYYHHYRQINSLLDRIAIEIARYLENIDKKYMALPIPASQIVNWQTQQAHLSHKRIAIQAGLGWLGRNNLVVTKDYGAQVRLVTILTNINFTSEAFRKPLPFNCGDCKKCLAACPAGAIRMDPLEFDHFKCFEKLKEFQRKGYVGQYICGICVKVCGPMELNSATGI